MYPVRIYVEAQVRFSPDGNMLPISIRWTDGRVFEIDRILDVRRAASEAGGGGVRFTVKILGHERYLFFEDIYSDTGKTRWFVESKMNALGA